jgi:hypothetical protein
MGHNYDLALGKDRRKADANSIQIVTLFSEAHIVVATVDHAQSVGNQMIWQDEFSRCMTQW